MYYLIQNNVQLKDFKEFALTQTEYLCNHIEEYVKENNIEIKYLSTSKISKDVIAKKEFDKNINKVGLIAAFSVVELCNTMTVAPNHNTKKLEVTSRPTKCKYYCFYYNDAEFGWMFLKIQTLNKKISDSFDGLIKKINNLLPNIEKVFSHSCYWCIDQCEFATDINFKSRSDLSSFYKTLVETTYFTFSSEDIYSFFGRNVSKIHTFRKGEIISDLRNRYQGYRIKFKINNNQIKMYDKGNNLRIEVTINNPKDFKILKEKEKLINHKEFETVKEWVPMGKSIANLYRYIEISKSITKRYIEAIPEIDVNEISIEEVTKISTSKEVKGRRYSGFNVLEQETLLLFQIITSGDFLINGFNNKNVRQRYFKENSEIAKNINKITRLFSKLRAHGIIKKVARKNKYYLTNDGRKLISNVLIYTRKEILN